MAFPAYLSAEVFRIGIKQWIVKGKKNTVE